MSGFLYFAAGVEATITLERAKQLDLGYAFDAAPGSAKLEGRTPSGGVGMLFADPSRLGEATFAYMPDAQEWIKRPGDDSIWLGWYKKLPPTPAELGRAKGLPGEALELGDGRRWMIPRLLYYSGGDGFVLDLPCRAKLLESGEWGNGEVLEKYAAAAEFGERLYQGMVRSELGQAPRLTTTEMLDIACELLSINYAVHKLEVSALGLLAIDETLVQIARAAADFNTFEEWYQKKTSDSDRVESAG